MALRGLPSSSSTSGWAYDVFLSFRGKDTRMTFTGHLYNSLHQRGIHTFFDDEELRRGEEIRPSLVKAIKESRIAIIVFSQNYASSTFCLDELVNILEHIKGKHRLVWPIFYDVDPSEIRHLSGSLKDSFAKHEERFKDDKEKVLKWRLALQKAANLSGDHLKSGYECEHEFIGKIVEEVSRKINHIPLYVADNPVGLEPPMQEVISLLELESNDRVNMVGIYGIGGIGKSTIARAIYNYIADQFEGLCFLDDVRVHGLVQLQETLLSEAAGERNIKLGSVHQGIPIINRRLQNKKILLVLDNVDKLKQLQCIAGGKDWFGSGSRVIITTRNKHLLACHGVDRVYEVKELDLENALELFILNAFKSHEVDSIFLGLSIRVVLYANGLPLALEVIGSNLFGKGTEEWCAALDKYESIPISEIHEVLKVSYDGLDDEEKEIFLDIACCFKGESWETVKTMLDACSFHPQSSINGLIDKSLLKIESMFRRTRVTMHDLIQRMGKEIVRQESKDVGKRSRLWSCEDIVHILEENMGSDKIEVIILDPPEEINVYWDGKAFKEMKKLRILIVRNTCFLKWLEHLPNSLRVLEWCKGSSSPLGPFPCDFHGRQLVILNFQHTYFQLDKPLQDFRTLTRINFEFCDSLQQLPDLSRAPSLKQLRLYSCKNLNKIHDSVGFLKKLEKLSICECSNLSVFPPIKLPSLEELNLQDCTSLRNFPETLEKNENELIIRLERSGIEELPSSILKLKGLKGLRMSKCRRLNRVPSGILLLPQLERFDATESGMSHFYECGEGQEKIDQSTIMPSGGLCFSLNDCDLKDEFLLSPTIVTQFYHVIELDLGCNSFTVLPESFKQCHFLKKLNLDRCKNLREIEGIPPNFLNLSAQYCTSLSSQSSSMLVRQVMLKSGRCFIQSGKVVPEWFDYSCNDKTLTFWFRKKVPVMALCFVTEEYFITSLRPEVHARINGSKAFRYVEPKCSGSMVFLPFQDPKFALAFYNIDLIELCSESEALILEHEWNCVEITPWARMNIGVYVDKQETSMEDIRFKDPDLHGFFPLHNEQRTFSDVEACETSDAQQQQHSALSHILSEYRRVGQDTNCDLDAMMNCAKELYLNQHKYLDGMNMALTWRDDATELKEIRVPLDNIRLPPGCEDEGSAD